MSPLPLSGICAWPGGEGQALALSSIVRQPLCCVLLQHLPASAAYQAAFSAATLTGEQVGATGGAE